MILLEVLQDRVTMFMMRIEVWREHEVVTLIDHHTNIEKVPNDVYKFLEHGWGITEPKRHHKVLKDPW